MVTGELKGESAGGLSVLGAYKSSTMGNIVVGAPAPFSITLFSLPTAKQRSGWVYNRQKGGAEGHIRTKFQNGAAVFATGFGPADRPETEAEPESLPGSEARLVFRMLKPSLATVFQRLCVSLF